MGRTHLDPKSKKKCILFSSIFNVDRPFQRYLLKTSGPGENNPITKRKNNFFSKFPRCKISTSTFSEIGNKKKINGFGVWSGPFFLTWVHLKGSVASDKLIPYYIYLILKEKLVMSHILRALRIRKSSICWTRNDRAELF